MRKCAYPKLKGRIIEKFGTQSDFADAMGMTKATLSTKMMGNTEFKKKEIVLAMNLLGIDDVTAYFFENKVG